MGGLSSKGQQTASPSRPPSDEASATSATPDHGDRRQAKPLTAVPSFHQDVKRDPVIHQTAAKSEKWGSLMSIPLPRQSSKSLKQRQRRISADIPSYRKKAAIDLCLEALNILDASLSSLPIPGLGAAPMMLAVAIKRIQNMSSAEGGWDALTKRLQHLTYLTNRIRDAPGMEDIVNSCLKPATGQLEQLAIDIGHAGRERNALYRFLTSNAESDSIASHDRVLDRLISELTSKLCMDTALTMREVREELKRISEKLELRNGQDDLPVSGIEMRDNTITNVRGNSFSNIHLVKGMSVSMVGNTATNIGGDLFSNISFSDGRERTLSLPASRPAYAYRSLRASPMDIDHSDY